MARPIPGDRFAAVIDVATSAFVRQGYQRTQMQDVADALGVGKGTVYATVSTKEALFLACVRFADGHDPLPDPSAWPLPAPGDGDLLALVTERLAEVGELALSRMPDDVQGDAAEEIALVVTDLVGRLRSHRRAIKLVDRCAPEIPDLAELWFGTGRAHLVKELADHLRRRAAQGVLRDVGDESRWYVVARTVVEICVMWAVHLEWDPAPAAFRATPHEREAAEVLAGLFAHGLVARDNHQE